MKKTYEELERELETKKELLSKLEQKLNKTDFLLSEWINCYSFNNMPDPTKAIQWAKNTLKDTPEDMQGKQSWKWFFEYNRIHDIVDMAMDYTDGAIELIDEAKAKEAEKKKLQLTKSNHASQNSTQAI